MIIIYLSLINLGCPWPQGNWKQALGGLCLFHPGLIQQLVNEVIVLSSTRCFFIYWGEWLTHPLHDFSVGMIMKKQWGNRGEPTPTLVVPPEIKRNEWMTLKKSSIVGFNELPPYISFLGWIPLLFS